MCAYNKIEPNCIIGPIMLESSIFIAEIFANMYAGMNHREPQTKLIGTDTNIRTHIP